MSEYFRAGYVLRDGSKSILISDNVILSEKEGIFVTWKINVSVQSYIRPQFFYYGSPVDRTQTLHKALDSFMVREYSIT